MGVTLLALFCHIQKPLHSSAPPPSLFKNIGVFLSFFLSFGKIKLKLLITFYASKVSVAVEPLNVKCEVYYEVNVDK